MGFLGEMFAEERSPAPVPLETNAAIAAQNAIGQETLGLAREQFAWAKEFSDRLRADNAAASEQQMRIADANERRAEGQWQRYQQIGVPAEDRLAKAAAEWDTPERREADAARAAADVSTAFDAQRANTARQAQSLMNPNSGRFAEVNRLTDLDQARATAGAMNSARRNTELAGLSMTQQVANLGRGMPQTGIAADQLALGGAAQAVAGRNQTAGTAGQLSNAGLDWYRTASNAQQGAGNLANSAYGTFAGSYGDTLRYNMDSKKIVNQWVNNIASSAGFGMGFSDENMKTDVRPYRGGYTSTMPETEQSGSGGGMLSAFRRGQKAGGEATAAQANLAGMAGGGEGAFFSDEQKKQGIVATDDQQILERLERIPVKQWRYKPGVEDGGEREHVGPMAQDVQANLGDAVAPGGTQIDMISMNGVLLAGLQALTKKVDRLASGQGQDFGIGLPRKPTIEATPMPKKIARAGAITKYADNTRAELYRTKGA